MESDPQLPNRRQMVRNGFREPPSDMWQYANLEPLVALVENAINQGRLSRDSLIPIQITPSKEVFENVRARWEYFEACCPPRNRDM